MKIQKIQLRNGVFFRDGVPIPPGLIIEGDFELRIRLQSSRSGLYGRWRAGASAMMALNDAPYRPLLRSTVKTFVWTPPNTKDCGRTLYMPEYDLPPDVIVQTGSGVPNWVAKGVSPIPDPIREWLLKNAPDENAIANANYKQGNLAVLAVVDPGLVLPIGSGNKRFLNHYILGHRGVAVRRLYGRWYALVLSPGGMWILSPDHPDAPVRLAAGVWLLSHPHPYRDDSKD